MEKAFAEFLNNWYEEYKIFNKCENDFWACYENYKLEEPGEYSKVFQNEDKNVSISLEKIAFCIEPNRCGKPTIQIDYDIIFKESQIGWYREIYFIDGEFVDNIFVID